MSLKSKLLAGCGGARTDPYFRYVSLLANTTSSNGAQNNTFLDSSTNNFTITRNGNTTQGSFSPYGSNWSNYFDGSGDYLTAPSNAAFGIGTGDYTIEAWVYKTSSSRLMVLAIASAGLSIAINASGDIEVCRALVAIDFTFTAGIANNTWTHIAVARSGTTLRAFKDGVSLGSQTSSTSYGQSTCYIGIDADASSTPFSGYISNLRLVKGTAVYISTFTPPTAPLTAISGTSLLTCQSNRFIDNSTNNFTITKNGDTKVTPFSPFSPTSAYSTTANGGSAYFDGSGDYLTTPSSAALNLSSGNWTIQGWFYPTAYSASNNVIAYIGASAADKIVIATIGTSGYLYYLLDGNVVISTTTAAPLNAWSFFALVKSGSTTTLYLNGSSIGTTTSAPASTNKSANIGSDAGGAVYQGYLANFRVLNGTADTAVPTAPLTAITNTSLLLNATNAGIYDSAVQNDMETVGNAQVSTTQAKFGTTSMYFDGSGDYLSVPSAPSLIFNGSFTIEFWVNFSSLPTGYIVLTVGTTANTQLFITTKANGTGLRFGLSYVAEYAAATQTWATGTWYHVALVRNGTDVKFYVNGTNVSDGTYTNSTTYSGALLVGGTAPSTYDFNGYIDDLRITKGVARYTSNFTPPTAAFPVQ